MPAKTLNKSKEKTNNWINSHPKEATLEEYRSEMQVAENADFISFEDHKKNMNKWLAIKL
jgi:hypothetical protein